MYTFFTLISIRVAFATTELFMVAVVIAFTEADINPNDVITELSNKEVIS